MKKAICLLMTLIFTFLFAFMSFAENEVIVDDPTAPGSGQTVIQDMYDEEVPQSPPEDSNDSNDSGDLSVLEVTVENIEDSTVPASGELVQTGGIPAYVFYVIGGVCIVAAIVLATRKGKESNAG